MIFFSKLKSQQLTTSLKIVWDFCQVKFSRDTTIQIVEYMDFQTLVFIKFWRVRIAVSRQTPNFGFCTSQSVLSEYIGLFVRTNNVLSCTVPHGTKQVNVLICGLHFPYPQCSWPNQEMEEEKHCMAYKSSIAFFKKKIKNLTVLG